MHTVFFEANGTEQKGLEGLIAKTEAFNGVKVDFVPEKLTEKNLDRAADANVISIFINSAINKDIIDKLPNLKLIVTRSTGFDHIDCAYATSKGIKVANMPAYGSRTVAEYTLGLILGLSRKILAASYQVKNGQGFDICNFMGFELFGKTLGIIGTGRIGLIVAEIAKSFGLKVIAFDSFPNTAQAQAVGFEYVALEDLLGRSDIITLHVPYNKSTHHLINKENVKKIKPGALLVNTARGEICDTEALLIGIQEKIIAGAALDVIEGERSLKEESQFFVERDAVSLDSEQIKHLLEDHILIGRPEVFLTPHIAFFTAEAENEIISTSIGNIVAFLKNEDKNLVKA